MMRHVTLQALLKRQSVWSVRNDCKNHVAPRFCSCEIPSNWVIPWDVQYTYDNMFLWDY